MTTTPDLIERLKQIRAFLNNYTALSANAYIQAHTEDVGCTLETKPAFDTINEAITALESRQAAGVDAIMQAVEDASENHDHGCVTRTEPFIELPDLREILAKHLREPTEEMVSRGADILYSEVELPESVRWAINEVVVQIYKAMLDALPQPEVK